MIGRHDKGRSRRTPSDLRDAIRGDRPGVNLGFSSWGGAPPDLVGLPGAEHHARGVSPTRRIFPPLGSVGTLPGAGRRHGGPERREVRHGEEAAPAAQLTDRETRALLAAHRAAWRERAAQMGVRAGVPAWMRVTPRGR